LYYARSSWLYLAYASDTSPSHFNLFVIFQRTADRHLVTVSYRMDFVVMVTVRNIFDNDPVCLVAGSKFNCMWCLSHTHTHTHTLASLDMCYEDSYLSKHSSYFPYICCFRHILKDCNKLIKVFAILHN